MAKSTKKAEPEAELTLVDCDIHQTFRSEDEIIKYLPPRYRDRGIQLPTAFYSNPGGYNRTDVEPEDGGMPGSTPENVQKHLLNKYPIEHGILTGDVMGVSVLPNRDYAAELARAYNEWLVDRWLPSDDRLLGSVLAAPQHPAKSAEIIREYGTHPKMVQVIMNAVSRSPYGHPEYWPIYEAAEEVGIPVAIHLTNVGNGISHPPYGVGYPSTYFERHNAFPLLYMGQLNSMVSEGVFEKFPDFDFVCIEGGFGWVPHLMWRMDKNWKGLRSQVPWLEKPPSQYILENVRFTTQPIEEPERPEYLLQIFEMMHAEQTLMFSSDYPHWDGDDPRYALPLGRMSDSMKKRILHENAETLYDL